MNKQLIWCNISFSSILLHAASKAGGENTSWSIQWAAGLKSYIDIVCINFINALGFLFTDITKEHNLQESYLISI